MLSAANKQFMLSVNVLSAVMLSVIILIVVGPFHAHIWNKFWQKTFNSVGPFEKIPIIETVIDDFN